jgi:hypothetical protein
VEAKTKYRVRDGFALHPQDGSEPLLGGTVVELTSAEAVIYAVQIELVGQVKAKTAKVSTDAAD